MASGQSKWSALAADLERAMATNPRLIIAILFLLTPEQWASLLSGNVYGELDALLEKIAARAIGKYPLNGRELSRDAAHDLFIKLYEGTFLKNYRPERRYPRAYLKGCARNYARVIARSLWRRYKRENGGDPAVVIF
ncbi:MAG TPA: hypothetical protein VGN17_28465 [Bryobacteraceae bacterium]|jgi:hypothetical protein